jgi:ketosteroid isomerase-like protein
MPSEEAADTLNALERGSIEQRLRDFWSVRLEDAAAAIGRYAADDVHFRILGGPPSLPGPWAFDGKPNVIEAVRAIDTNLEFLSFEIVDLILDGQEVALRWHARLRNRGTGVLGDLAVFDHIVLRDGLIARYEEFLDTDGFRRLMTGEPQPELARQANRIRRTLPDVLRAARFGHPARISAAERDSRAAMLRRFWHERVESGSVVLPRYFTEECELHLIGDPAAVPFARSHYGIDAVRALVDQVDMEFEYLSFDIRKVLVDGDRAALHWGADVRHRGTSASGHVESFDHIVLDGERIVAITEFFDTAATATWIEG